MPDDQDIEELKKLYLDRVSSNGVNRHSEKAKRRYEFNFDKKQTVLIVFIIIPISLLIFILGFFVGKGFSPLDQKKQPPPLNYNVFVPNRSDQREVASAGLVNDLSKRKSAFYVTVVPLDTTPPGHSKEAQPSQTPSKKETGKETREVIKLNERKILPDSKKIDLTSGQGMHTVQVGSYRSKMQASTLVEKLNKKGYPAYLIEASIPQKGLWYRIRVGYFQTREEAEKISSEIKEKEKLFNYVTLSSK